MVGSSTRVGQNKPFRLCVEGLTCIEVVRSIEPTSHNNLITLKANGMVRALFSHWVQRCPLLRGQVVTLNGIYFSSLAVATNDVDNI